MAATAPDERDVPGLARAPDLDHLRQERRRGQGSGGKGTITVAEGLAKYRGLNVLGHIVKPMTPNALSSLLAKLE